MGDPIADLAKLLAMNKGPKPLGEGMPESDDWRNPGWFWHPDDMTYRPFPAASNPDPKTYYRVDPWSSGSSYTLEHAGQEARMRVGSKIPTPFPRWGPEGGVLDYPALKLVLERLHLENIRRIIQEQLVQP